MEKTIKERKKSGIAKKGKERNQPDQYANERTDLLITGKVGSK